MIFHWSKENPTRLATSPVGFLRFDNHWIFPIRLIDDPAQAMSGLDRQIFFLIERKSGNIWMFISLRRILQLRGRLVSNPNSLYNESEYMHKFNQK
ncbi:hypothetical protein EGX73_02100 [Enterococcus sp. FDAARGOS_553]|jgi:hypothetical protein|nr:hypothetical protein EGX73_02100 [Enterococcus sp. FDAARGOS_553]PCD96836.1 hypothetical protein CKY18_03250 [Enterococcus gallinarum]ROY91265.1 hypothetical protein EGW76_02925 [Enterococcus gallinarum]GMS46787.1 hypothetical protein NUITMVRE34_00670 [Enterococcus gallinarum]GMS50415.1 hypothetical protein NUITMVRE35_05500 [Enterococcus gallinarum]